MEVGALSRRPAESSTAAAAALSAALATRLALAAAARLRAVEPLAEQDAPTRRSAVRRVAQAGAAARAALADEPTSPVDIRSVDAEGVGGEALPCATSCCAHTGHRPVVPPPDPP